MLAYKVAFVQYVYPEPDLLLEERDWCLTVKSSRDAAMLGRVEQGSGWVGGMQLIWSPRAVTAQVGQGSVWNSAR